MVTANSESLKDAQNRQNRLAGVMNAILIFALIGSTAAVVNKCYYGEAEGNAKPKDDILCLSNANYCYSTTRTYNGMTTVSYGCDDPLNRICSKGATCTDDNNYQRTCCCAKDYCNSGTTVFTSLVSLLSLFAMNAL